MEKALAYNIFHILQSHVRIIMCLKKESLNPYIHSDQKDFLRDAELDKFASIAQQFSQKNLDTHQKEGMMERKSNIKKSHMPY